MKKRKEKKMQKKTMPKVPISYQLLKKIVQNGLLKYLPSIVDYIRRFG